MDKNIKIAFACIIVGGVLSQCGSNEPEQKVAQKPIPSKPISITFADRIKSVPLGTKWSKQNNFCERDPVNNGLQKDRFHCPGKLPEGAKSTKHNEGYVGVTYGIDSKSIVQSSVVKITDGVIANAEEILELVNSQYDEAPSIEKGQNFLEASIVYGGRQHDITTAIYGGCKAYYFDKPGNDIIGGKHLIIRDY